jgi:hypothetical protein
VEPRKLVGLAVAVAAAVVAASAATSFLVAQSAAQAAGPQPYCIQIADTTSDYRPARSWLDLSALTMWAKHDGPLFMQHHAILVAGELANPRLYHWSYRRLAFEPGVLNERIEGHGPAVTCVPVHDFAANLPALIPEWSDSTYVRYSAHEAYRIPTGWQAKWSGGMNPTLLLATTAPDFRPLDRRWSLLAPEERDGNSVFVEWNPEWVLSLMKSAPGGTVVEQSTEFGLSKTKTITHGRDGKDYVGYSYLTYGDEAPHSFAINTTVIGCGMPSDSFPKSCQHRFINKGRHFYFRHRPEDVSDWRGMQQRVLDLMTSFEAHDGRS